MNEYDWRKEREKYKVPSQKTPEKTAETIPQGGSTPPPPQILSGNGGGWKVVGIVAVLALLGLAAIIIWFVMTNHVKQNDDKPTERILVVHEGGNGGGSVATKPKTETTADTATQLQNAAEKHKHAVGVVVLGFTQANNVRQRIPIGTAWACAPDKFATNGHVVVALKAKCQQMVKNFIAMVLADEAKKDGGKDLETYLAKLSPEERQAKMAAAAETVLTKIARNFGAEICINGKAHFSLPVTGVRVHRNYGEKGTSFNPDVGMLLTSTDNDDYFPLAERRELMELKAGTPVGFLGFPMENLTNDNVNLESVVATMQTGIVSAVSDFDMKDAGGSGNYLIRHNLPSTGGASGSPIFNAQGQVVALLYAGNIDVIPNAKGSGVHRTPHGAQINFAVRSDLLEGLGEPVPIIRWLLQE